jgi:serine/threonine protein phosphatase 1
MLAESLGPGWLPQGLRIYAIGDPHGCVERLAELHDRIAEDLAERPVGRSLLVHVGDYVDRGPDSAGVVALVQGEPIAGVQTINLAGNHEQMMLAALDPRAPDEVVGFWLENGGGRDAGELRRRSADMRSWAAVPAGRPRLPPRPPARASRSAAISSPMPGCGRTSRWSGRT